MKKTESVLTPREAALAATAGMSLTEKAAELLKIRDKVARAEARLKALKADEDAREALIFEQIVAEGFQNITVAGYRITPEIKTIVSITEEKREAAIAALRAHGAGSLVIESVIKRDFNGWVREVIDANGGDCPQWIRDTMSVYEKQSLSIRKNTVKKSPAKGSKTKKARSLK